MTIDRFASLVGACLGIGGVVLVLAALGCFISIGNAGPVVHSIHMLAGWVLGTFGVVMIGSGLTLSSATNARAGAEAPAEH